MAKSTYDPSEGFSVKAYQAEVDAKVAMDLIGAEKVAALRTAIYMKSITRTYDEEQKLADKALADRKAKAQKNFNAKLATLSNEKEDRIKANKLREAFEKGIAKLEEQHANEAAARQKLIAKAKEADERKLAQIAKKNAETQYRQSTIAQRKLIQDKKVETAKSNQERLKQESDANKVMLKAHKDRIKELDEQKKLRALSADEEQELARSVQAVTDISARQRDIKRQTKKERAEELAAIEASAQLEETIFHAQSNQLGKADKLKFINEERKKAEEELLKRQQEIADLEKAAASATSKKDKEALEKKAEELKVELDASGLEKRVADLNNSFKEAAKGSKKSEKTKEKVQAAVKEKQNDREIEKAETDEKAMVEWANFMSAEGAKDNAGKALANAVGAMGAAVSNMTKKVDENIESFYSYQATVEARLEGSEESYKDALKTVSKQIGASMLVSQKDVLDNIKKASDSGIAYNLELRAFLQTTKDKIIDTFDAFDSNLMRLIRIQQADTTAARLGMEASLKKLFNEYFSDTSFLTDAFDTISQNLIDANAQLTRDASLQFEYIVQKWLGALYSVGVSDSALSSISQGLTYLATGDVEKLTGNDALNSLLAMSASRAGKSYADILTGGLDAEITNDLLKSMIEYLQTIANNTDNNQVTKSAYTNLFGISMSDLSSITNLSSTDLENLHSSMLSYDDSITELNNQLQQVTTRVHASTKLETMFENAMSSASIAIGNNPGVYGLWKTLNVIEGLTGGIPIPGVSVMGNMVDLHQTVIGLTKAGIAGLPLMGTLLGSIFSGGVNNLGEVKDWDFDEYTSRGGSRKAISKGTAYGTSSSSEMSMTGSASADDIKQTSMGEGTAAAEEDSKTTNSAESVNESTDTMKLIHQAVDNGSDTVIGVLCEIRSLTDSIRGAMGGASGTGGSGGSGGSGGLTSNTLTADSFVEALSNMSILSITSTGATQLTRFVSTANGATISADTVSQMAANVSSYSMMHSLQAPETTHKVELNSLSNDAKTVFEQAVRTAVISAFGGESSSTVDDRLSDLVDDIVSKTINVKITNDYADETYQKIALS